MTKEDFSRGKCPICGTETIFKVNKNGVLYTFCRNSHHVKLGKYDSKEAIEAIEVGKAWHNGLLHLYPLNHQQHEQLKGQEDNVRREQAIYDRHSIERRTTDDAGTGSNGGAGTDPKPAKRSFEIGFF